MANEIPFKDRAVTAEGLKRVMESVDRMVDVNDTPEQVVLVTPDDIENLASDADQNAVIMADGEGHWHWEQISNNIDKETNSIINYASNIMSGQIRNIHFSTVEPTPADGNVGDIWIVVEE